MKKNNLLIIILLIVVLVLGFIFALRVFTTKSIEKNVNYSESEVSKVKDNIQQSFEDGMKYAEEESSNAKENLDIESEKEKIRTAITMAMLGNNTLNSLTYDSFDKQLKDTFSSGNYTLTGPDSSGKFTLKINTRTYTIDSNGKILE